MSARDVLLEHDEHGRLYRDDMASIPDGWGKPIPFRPTVTVSKQYAEVIYTREMLEDRVDFTYWLFHAPTWEDRLAQLVRKSSIRHRLRLRWHAIRRRLAVRVGLWLDPNLRDEWS